MSEELEAQILIGDKAEEFVASELGRTILGMAKQDADMALHRFDECDITDHTKLMDIKVELRVAQRFNRYLAELITRGREALEVYKHVEKE